MMEYKGPHTNVVTNSLLLRSDIHTLFDLHLLAIDPEYRVHLAPQVRESKDYAELHGRELQLPADESAYPNDEWLRAHNDKCSSWFGPLRQTFSDLARSGCCLRSVRRTARY